MSVAYNPRTVMNGLLVYLDAANVKSYPGSGVTWSSLVDGTQVTVAAPYSNDFFAADGNDSGLSAAPVDLTSYTEVTVVASVKAQGGKGTVFDMAGPSTLYTAAEQTSYPAAANTSTRTGATSSLSYTAGEVTSYTQTVGTDTTTQASSAATAGTATATGAYAATARTTNASGGSTSLPNTAAEVTSYQGTPQTTPVTDMDQFVGLASFELFLSARAGSLKAGLRNDTVEVALSVPYTPTANDKLAVIFRRSASSVENVAIYQNGTKLGGSTPGSALTLFGASQLGLLLRNQRADPATTLSLRSVALYSRALTTAELVQVTLAVGT